MKIDRRKKYYLILDCETATLPFAMNYDSKAKEQIALAKPLIYDIGWQVIDRKGNVYVRKNFLISETFSVPQIFNTAYYASKRPIYIERLQKGEITLTDWETAMQSLILDLEVVDGVGAYNSMFDFKKAIPFTERYIKALYSPKYFEWEKGQKWSCNEIAKGKKFSNPKGFDKDNFELRGQKYPLFDVWGLSCQHIMNNDTYRDMCIKNNWKSKSGKYYTTSAEKCYSFFKGDTSFEEAHTAIDDAKIESELFTEILKRTKNKFDGGIIYFPFRILGTVPEEETEE